MEWPPKLRSTSSPSLLDQESSHPLASPRARHTIQRLREHAQREQLRAARLQQLAGAPPPLSRHVSEDAASHSSVSEQHFGGVVHRSLTSSSTMSSSNASSLERQLSAGGGGGSQPSLPAPAPERGPSGAPRSADGRGKLSLPLQRGADLDHLQLQHQLEQHHQLPARPLRIVSPHIWQGERGPAWPDRPALDAIHNRHMVTVQTRRGRQIRMPKLTIPLLNVPDVWSPFCATSP